MALMIFPSRPRLQPRIEAFTPKLKRIKKRSSGSAHASWPAYLIRRLRVADRLVGRATGPDQSAATSSATQCRIATRLVERKPRTRRRSGRKYPRIDRSAIQYGQTQSRSSGTSMP